MRRKTLFLILFSVAATLIFIGTPFSRAQEKPKVPALPAGWTTPVNISNEPGSSELPTIVVDDNGRVYATWTEWYGGVGAPRGMMFNSTDFSGQWGTATGAGLFYTAIDDVGFPAVACHPTNGEAYQLYHDGDFANANMEIIYRKYVHNTEVDAAWMSKTPYSSSYVTAAVNPVNSFLYTCWMDDLTDTDTFELVWRSLDPSTGTWDAGDVLPAFTGDRKYWPHLNFDAKGTAHLLFITRPPAQIWYMKNATPHNSSTWTTPVNLSGDTARDWVAGRLAADKDGDVYVVWYGDTGGYESQTEEVYFRKTINGVWQPTLNLTNTPGRSEGSFIAVNPDSKDIFVAYHERTVDLGWEVMLKIYETQANGTKGWSPAINITNSPGDDGEPCIRIDSRGSVHLAYHFYVQASGNNEIYYTMKPGLVKPQPPTTISLAPGLDSAKAKKTNLITWENNPSNSNLQLAGNKIWRKLQNAEDSTFSLLGTVSATAIQHQDTNLDILTKYAYRITVLPQTGEESDPSSTVSESTGRQFDLAPISVAVTGGVNKVLFYREKRNTITYAANAGNPAADVSGFEIYRKLTSEANSALALIATVSGSTMGYTDTKLSILKNYSYAVKTKFSDGKTSEFSTVVGDAQGPSARGGGR